MLLFYYFYCQTKLISKYEIYEIFLLRLFVYMTFFYSVHKNYPPLVLKQNIIKITVFRYRRLKVYLRFGYQRHCFHFYFVISWRYKKLIKIVDYATIF